MPRSAGPPSEHMQRVLKHGVDGRDLQETSPSQRYLLVELALIVMIVIY